MRALILIHLIVIAQIGFQARSQTVPPPPPPPSGPPSDFLDDPDMEDDDMPPDYRSSYPSPNAGNSMGRPSVVPPPPPPAYDNTESRITKSTRQGGDKIKFKVVRGEYWEKGKKRERGKPQE